MQLPPVKLENLESEQGIVGGILLEPESIDRVMDVVQPEDFAAENMRLIYEHFVDMRLAGEPIDLVTVTSRLDEVKLLDRVGGPGFLASLTDNVGSARNIEFYGQTVKKQAILRAIYDMGLKMLLNLKPEANVEQVIGGLVNGCVEILSKNSASKEVTIHNVVASIQNKLQAIMQGQAARGVPTGLKDLDRLTGGLQPSDLIILAARPSMGKSALALNVAFQAARYYGVPVGFFSLEMSKEQLGGRILSAMTHIPTERVIRYELGSHEWGLIDAAQQKIVDLPLYIDDTGGLAIEELQARAIKWKSMYGVGLIVLEYMQYLATKKGKGSREQDISHISRSLKALAKELKIPLLALSQLNRSLEYRDDKRPKLSDLRESGSIEQDADVVLMIFRQEVYTQDPEDSGKAEILIRKQRNGRLGTVKVFFDGNCCVFKDYTGEEEPGYYREDYGK